MDDLTKTQIVLLVLFVSFVTSIATGIVTVTLMNQSPQSVTQTINQVVEKTVERVIPGETKVREVQVSVPVTTSVSDEDLLAKAISQSVPSVVKIYSVGVAGSDIATTSVALETPRGAGFLVVPPASALAALGGDKNTRLIVTALSNVAEKESAYEISLSNGNVYRVQRVAADIENNIAILGISGKLAGLPSVALAKEGPVLGKSVFAPSYSGSSDIVAIGSVTGVRSGNASSTPILETTVSVKGGVVGSPVLDTRGIVVGVVTSDRITAHVGLISALLDSIKKTP